MFDLHIMPRFCILIIFSSNLAPSIKIGVRNLEPNIKFNEEQCSLRSATQTYEYKYQVSNPLQFWLDQIKITTPYYVKKTNEI
jgi:hypothetical protein